MATLLVTSSLNRRTSAVDSASTERRVHKKIHMRSLASVLTVVVVAFSSVSCLGAQTLRGSPASVDLMYSTAQRNDLRFLRTPNELYAAAHAGALEMLAVSNDLDLGAVKYPFVLPNTLRFADSLASAYHAGCGERIVVTSGARPLDEQPRNASPKSVHPTGMAVDFRKPRSPACLRWLRTNLVALERQHIVEATEERRPAHFHVAVLAQAPEPRLAFAADEVPATKAKATNLVRRRHSAHHKHPSAPSVVDNR
jgi:hypothetical protein